MSRPITCPSSGSSCGKRSTLPTTWTSMGLSVSDCTTSRIVCSSGSSGTVIVKVDVSSVLRSMPPNGWPPESMASAETYLAGQFELQLGFGLRLQGEHPRVTLVSSTVLLGGSVRLPAPPPQAAAAARCQRARCATPDRRPKRPSRSGTLPTCPATPGPKCRSLRRRSIPARRCSARR